MIKLSRRRFLRILTFTGAFVGVIDYKINILANPLEPAKPKPIMPISSINETVNRQVELLVQRLKEKGILWAPKKDSADGGPAFHWKSMQQIESGDVIFSIVNNQESDRVLKLWKDVVDKAEKLKSKILRKIKF